MLIIIDGFRLATLSQVRQLRCNEDVLALEALEKLMELIKRYCSKNSVSRHSCMIRELFVELSGVKKEAEKI